MEENNYTGADIERLCVASGLKKGVIAEKLGWNYPRLNRIFNKEIIKPEKIRPLLELLGVYDDELDYKKEYFIIKEKYEKLLLNQRVTASRAGTKTGQTSQKNNKNNTLKPSKTKG